MRPLRGGTQLSGTGVALNAKTARRITLAGANQASMVYLPAGMAVAAWLFGLWRVDSALYPLAKNIERHEHNRGNCSDREIRELAFEYPGKDSDADEPNSKNR
jgi:hypothetical protein